MITVLQTGCKLCKNGGIENYIMNNYRAIDKSKYRFIFLVDKEQEADNFTDEIVNMGGAVYYYNTNASIINRIRQKINILRSIDYSIAHVHVSCGERAIDGILAKCAHPKAKIIFHSHSNIGKRPLKYTLLIPVYRFLGNKLLACSSVAAQYFFGQSVVRSSKFSVALNAIDLDRFRFSSKSRNIIRNHFSIPEDTMLLGFVGRLSPEKNISLMLYVIEYFRKNGIDVKGIIVGDGTQKEYLIKQAEELGIRQYIIFAGNQSNTNEFMCAMDALLLPSFHEGLGIVLIEAQANSLTCFASDVVPKETNVTPFINYIDINKTPSEIADIIMDVKAKTGFSKQLNDEKSKIEMYDIRNNAKKLEKIYEKLAGIR